MGTAVRRVARSTFELDCACQGQQGLALISRALEIHRPYSVAFVNARMPPGWDDIETIGRIWCALSSRSVRTEADAVISVGH